MNIDRHNYEMYFLLYVDNELSAEERCAVEKFVAENIDLQTELELLMQTALPTEEIIFSAKNDLYKKELTPGHLQEQMLLHLDNELEPLQVSSLAAAIATNDDLKRKWNILQQTKLDPNEKIVFENKELLYRYEKDKVLSIRFWRAAAAILIIGATIFIGISKFSKDKNVEDIAKRGNNNSNQLPAKKESQSKPINILEKENNNNIAEQKPSDDVISVQPAVHTTTTPVKENNDQQQRGKNIVATSVKEKNNAPVKNNVVDPVEKKHNEEKSLVQKETNNLPKPYFENINNQNSNKTTSPIVQDNIKTLQNKNDDIAIEEKNIQQSKTKGPQVPVEDKPLTETNNGYAKNAVMNETASETGNNSVLFISEEKVNRSKIGGLFRKVKRVLARNANIKTGSSVKIAGLEFATR